MRNRAYNRPIVLCAFMLLAWGLAVVDSETAMSILGVAAGLVGGYVGIKGPDGSK